MVDLLIFTYLAVGLAMTVKWTKWTLEDLLRLTWFVYSWPLWFIGTRRKRSR